MPGSDQAWPAPSTRWNAASRPGLVQRPGVARRAWHVVAAVDDRAGNAVQTPRVAQQLALLQPASVGEIVVLDPREGERETIVAVDGREASGQAAG